IGVEGLDVGFVLVVPITTPPAAVVTAAVVDHSLAGFVDLSQTEHRFAAGGSGGAEQACGSETVAAFEPGPAQSVSTVFVVEEAHHPLRRCRIPAAPSRLDGCGEVLVDQSREFAVDGIIDAGTVDSSRSRRLRGLSRSFGCRVVDEEVERQCNSIT